MTFSAHPRLQDPLQFRKYVSPDDLLEGLRLTVAGGSSALHVWDSDRQAFLLRGTIPQQRGAVIVIGYDDVVSERFVMSSRWSTKSAKRFFRSSLNRFITIGTLLRRIDMFINELRGR